MPIKTNPKRTQSKPIKANKMPIQTQSPNPHFWPENKDVSIFAQKAHFFALFSNVFEYFRTFSNIFKRFRTFCQTAKMAVTLYKITAYAIFSSFSHKPNVHFHHLALDKILRIPVQLIWAIFFLTNCRKHFIIMS